MRQLQMQRLKNPLVDETTSDAKTQKSSGNSGYLSSFASFVAATASRLITQHTQKLSSPEDSLKRDEYQKLPGNDYDDSEDVAKMVDEKNLLLPPSNVLNDVEATSLEPKCASVF